MVAKLPSANDQVTREIDDYEKQLIDIDTLSEKANEAQREKDDLRHKLDLLEKRVKVRLKLRLWQIRSNSLIPLNQILLSRIKHL